MMQSLYGPGYINMRKSVRLLHPALDRWMVEFVHGRLLSRGALTTRQRTLCALAVMSGSSTFGQFKVGALPALHICADLETTYHQYTIHRQWFKDAYHPGRQWLRCAEYSTNRFLSGARTSNAPLMRCGPISTSNASVSNGLAPGSQVATMYAPSVQSSLCRACTLTPAHCTPTGHTLGSAQREGHGVVHSCLQGAVV